MIDCLVVFQLRFMYIYSTLPENGLLSLIHYTKFLDSFVNQEKVHVHFSLSIESEKLKNII